MKYALLNMDRDVQGISGEAIVNIGCVAMRLAIYRLLIDMGIAEEDIIQIDWADINLYDGEYVIMPINMHWMQDVGNKKLLSMSHKIKPVFLSISLNDTSLNSEQVAFLKRYEPIGCRDDRTMHALVQKGIDAYIFGCMAGTFPLENVDKTLRTDIVFADVPYGVLKYVPDNIKKDVKFVSHELPADQIPQQMTVEEYTKNIMEYYRTRVKLVVTSRFHGAVIPMSYGVPVIVVNENYTFRFSWLKKIVPFYTRNTFSEIDWNPKPVDFLQIKNRMLQIAQNKIQEARNKYELLCDQSAQLENDVDNDWGLIDYYDEAIDYIASNWSKTDHIKYAFWGVNNNAEAICQYISTHYPKASLVAIYDTYRDVQFCGINSKKPDEICENDNVFYFVTTFVAGYFAEELFRKKGIMPSKYFVCKRSYISENDLFPICT